MEQIKYNKTKQNKTKENKQKYDMYMKNKR